MIDERITSGSRVRQPESGQVISYGNIIFTLIILEGQNLYKFCELFQKWNAYDI